MFYVANTGEGVVAAGWSDEELAASLTAYREMQRKDAEGIGYMKKQVYRDLAQRFGRSEKSYEFRMQNISSVLDELGMPWIDGLKPKQNVGAGVKPRLVSLIKGSVATGQVAPQTEASYRSKLPMIRRWLIEVARAREAVAYSDVMLAFEIDRFSLRHALGRLGHESVAKEEPIITALVVGKKTRRCSSGLLAEFGVVDDQVERERLYTFWNDERVSALDVELDDAKDPLDERAARFASVAVRPEQAAFRRRVFLAWHGRCAVSGCGVRQALDAAHRKGRSWKLGHNNASDGLLLRKDLHALYDAGLLRLDEEGHAHVDKSVQSHYPGIDGVKVGLTCAVNPCASEVA